MFGENFFGSLVGDFLDIHAALGARDHGNGPRLSIDEHPEIKLASDVARLLYIYAAHDAAFGPRLMRHQRLAEQLGREIAHVGRDSVQLDAARFAATARMDLRLDDSLRLAERRERSRRFVGRGRELPLGNGNAEAPENLLGLIFVDVHSVTCEHYFINKSRSHLIDVCRPTAPIAVVSGISLGQTSTQFCALPQSATPPSDIIASSRSS